MKPIRPDEVIEKKQQYLPPEVFEAFNELIVKHWNGVYASFGYEEVAKLIAKKLNFKSSNTVYDENLLDVEDVYEEVGWHVETDQPAFNETYPSTFKFSKKKKK